MLPNQINVRHSSRNHLSHRNQHHYRRTLCGLYVVGDLEMIKEKPEDRILCLYCERIAAQKELSNPTTRRYP